MNIITTLHDITEDKALADARDEANDRINADRQAHIAAILATYPQIGRLNSGRSYAYVGPDRQYVESAYINRVVEAIEYSKKLTEGE
jgi:hypothetical protein